MYLNQPKLNSTEIFLQLYVCRCIFQHGIDSAKPLKYTHVDIAGSSGPFPGTPTGAPIAAFAQAYVLNRESSA